VGSAVIKVRRSDLSEPGITRRRRGKGFSYRGPDSAPVADPAVLARIKGLAVPPAWKDVWICPDSRGHIQAVGTDSAGRRQYLYHDAWRAERDQDKHDRMLEFGAALPRLRRMVDQHLDERGLCRNRVLAAAVRLIDLGFFRSGGEEYAADNDTYGLATILRAQVTCSRGQVRFNYPAKGSQQREQVVADARVCAVVTSLKRRKNSGDDLLAYRSGTRWHDVTAADINDYIREISGGEFTAKDFRTWHATVLAAVGLAVSGDAPGTDAARKRAVVRAVREVAGYLGNTPAVARGSYIDPRVIEEYQQGRTVARALGELGKQSEFGELATEGPVESAVLRLLAENG
jgi:DNA topoisomerase IB